MWCSAISFWQNRYSETSGDSCSIQCTKVLPRQDKSKFIV